MAPSLSLASGTPGAPDLVQVSRNADYDEATVTWVLYDPVAEYEIQRLEATTVSADDQSRIEYGNSVLFTVDGTIAGVDEYVDDTIDPEITYQYRVRAKGADYGLWSAYAFSGARPKAEDLAAPSNLEVARATDNAAVTVTWTAPDGDLDGYFVQRQELVEADGSTFFANAETVSGNNPLSASTMSYTDSAILPGRIYEYRVAAVKDDVVGEYSEWTRSAAAETSLGAAPENLRVSSETDRSSRLEYWLAWEEVDGADDYELQVRRHSVTTGATALTPSVLLTDPTYFVTAYGRAEFRVRGRKEDAALCGSGADDRCYTGWSGWLEQGYSPAAVTIPLPAPVSARPAPDAATMEVRDDLEAAVQQAVEPAGLPFDPSGIIDFIWLVAGSVVGIMVYRDGRGAKAALAFGVGLTFLSLWLFLGVRLVGLNEVWALGLLILVIVGGGLATARTLGFLGR